MSGFELTGDGLKQAQMRDLYDRTRQALAGDEQLSARNPTMRLCNSTLAGSNVVIHVTGATGINTRYANALLTLRIGDGACFEFVQSTQGDAQCQIVVPLTLSPIGRAPLLQQPSDSLSWGRLVLEIARFATAVLAVALALALMTNTLCSAHRTRMHHLPLGSDMCAHSRLVVEAIVSAQRAFWRGLGANAK